jgi:hypothetical protein
MLDMATTDDLDATRARSKSYPAVSLREAAARCQTLYDKDGWSETLAETAAVHWGYQGLNGASRPILAAVKQFGFIEYLGGGDNLKVKLTELAKRILRPVTPGEKYGALQEAMQNPKLYASLHEKFPDWKLPSEATLSARLEREEGIQPKALKRLVVDIKDSIAYLHEMATVHGEATISLSAKADGQVTRQAEENAREEPKAALQAEAGMQIYPMPGGEAYVVLPKSMASEEAERTKKWIEKVIIPAIQFAGDLD